MPRGIVVNKKHNPSNPVNVSQMTAPKLATTVLPQSQKPSVNSFAGGSGLLSFTSLGGADLKVFAHSCRVVSKSAERAAPPALCRRCQRHAEPDLSKSWDAANPRRPASRAAQIGESSLTLATEVIVSQMSSILLASLLTIKVPCATAPWRLTTRPVP